MKWKRRTRWIVAACLLPVLLLLVLLLSAPFWVNQNAVKREIERIVASATGGRVQYDRIDLHFLPMPGADLTQLRFSLPGTVEVQAQSASIDIRLLPLLLGNVFPHRVRILTPQILVQIDEPKPSPPSQPQTQQKPFSLKDTEASIRAVLTQIQSAAPGVKAEIEAGRVELRIGQRPPLMVEQIDVHFDVTGKTISAKLSCGSNLWTKFTADLQVTTNDLSGDGHVELSGLQVPRLGPMLGMQDGWPVQEATVNAKLELKMHGLSDAHAEVSVDTPKVALLFGKAHLDFVGPVIEAAAQTKGESMEVALRKAALDSPRVALSAKFVKNETGGYALESETSEVDLLALQAVGQALAPEVDWLVNFPVTIARGAVTSVKFNTQAAKLEDLFDLPALHVSGTVENVDLSLPVFYNLKVNQVSATASLEQGIVHVRQAQARLDKSTVRDGSFDMNLNLDALPLHVDATASVDLAEGLAVAKRVLPDPQIQQQLNQVKDLTGNAGVRVIVGGDVNNVTPRVEVSTLAVSARHELVPFPIRITRGALAYTGPALTVQGLDGAIGQSTFHGLSARLGLSPPYPLSSQQGSAVVALEELFHWASRQPQFEKQLDGVKQISGAVALSIAKLEVPLNSPEKLSFQVTATPQHVTLDAPKYGPVAHVDGGVVEVSQQSVNLKGVKASLLDAALVVSGRTNDYLKSLDNVQVSAVGTVGLDALEWVYAKAELPKELRLRAALNVSASTVEWRADSGVAARGSVNVAGGPKIGFGVRSIPKRVEVETLTLRDDASDVTIGGSLEGGHFKVVYKGKLAGSSIDHIFVEPLASVGQLEGDFSADGDLKRPDATTATGYLRGSMIRLPPVLPVPVTIEKLSVEAKDAVLLVKSATVSSGESRVDVSGNVTYTKDKFVVDADVRGEKVVIPTAPAQPETQAGPKSEPTSQSDSLIGNPEKQRALLHSLWAIPARGTVRVDIGLLRVGRIDVAPLVASATLTGERVDLRIAHAALCAVELSGGLAMTVDHAEASLKLSARGAQVEKTVTCLTNERLDITGKFDADGEFSTSGKLGTLLSALQGQVSLVAKDGRINKFDALAQVFKLINVTQVVAGKAPDLSKSGMAYYSATVKGKFNGPQFHVSEAILDASGFKVVAHGDVDYATQKINVDVLFAPLQTVNYVLSYIPILRNILGGTVLAVPLHVGGTVEKPIVLPYGARAVGSRLMDILGNTLNLPSDFIKLTPSAPAAGATTPQTSPSR